MLVVRPWALLNPAEGHLKREAASWFWRGSKGMQQRLDRTCSGARRVAELCPSSLGRVWPSAAA